MPGFYQKLGGVIKFLSNPCDAPLVVFVQTARAPAGRMFMQLVETSLLDVIRGYWRPAGLRTGRHGRRGRRGRKGGIPDTAELVADHIPGKEAVRNRPGITQGVKTMWVIDNAQQQAMFYMMIVDLVTDFLFDWTSNIYALGYCEDRKAGWTLCTGADISLGFLGWQALLPGFIEYESPNCGGRLGSIDFRNCSGGTAMVSASGFAVTAGPFMYYSGRLILQRTGEIVDGGDLKLATNGMPLEICMSCDFSSPTTEDHVFYEAYASGGHIVWTGIRAAGRAIPLNPPLEPEPEPGEKPSEYQAKRAAWKRGYGSAKGGNSSPDDNPYSPYTEQPLHHQWGAGYQTAIWQANHPRKWPRSMSGGS